MKKLLTLICLSLLSLTLLGGCGTEREDISSKVKLEVSHNITTENNKQIDITYPVVGGLESSRALSTINSSITNYVRIQEDEFNSALSGNDDATPINSDFDATVTKQITAAEKEEDETDPDNPDDENDNGEDASEGDENNPDQEGDAEAGADENSVNGQAGDPITLTMRFKITYHHDNILNIIETFEKVLGDDKNYKGQQSFVFDLEKGTPVSLGEIYDFESDFPTYVDEKITEKIENTKGFETFDDKAGFSGVRRDANFYLDEENEKLYIFYNALEISPEKNLLPTFEFTLKELSPYLTEDYQGRLD